MSIILIMALRAFNTHIVIIIYLSSCCSSRTSSHSESQFITEAHYNLELPINWVWMFLDSGRKLENPNYNLLAGRWERWALHHLPCRTWSIKVRVALCIIGCKSWTKEAFVIGMQWILGKIRPLVGSTVAQVEKDVFEGASEMGQSCCTAVI